MKKKMTLEMFSAACQQQTLAELPVILFSAKVYPVLFFSALLQKLRVSYQPVIKTVAYEGCSFSSIVAQLSTTFLGQQDFLWLGNSALIENASDRKQLLTLVAGYEGPHVLIGFIPTEDIPKSVKYTISLDEPLSALERQKLLAFLYPHVAPAVVEDLLKTVRTISLDHLVMVAQYAGVLGKNTQQFKQQWLTEVIEPEASLFALSQYFFARKQEFFWPLWELLKDQYAAPFWTTYWSEQLWRAHYVIKLYQEQKITDAKQLSFRLPFSFLQKDWKYLSLDELKNAHDFLYQGDYAFKNGNSEFFLDVFYTTFLAKQF